MVKVKICGITNLDDALASVDAGCDALGFVFYKKSPRYITPEKARDIINRLPENIIKIGVFANAREDRIKKIAKFCHLDILQFHGTETPEFCKKFEEYKIIKAFRVKDKGSLSGILKYHVFAYLFDSFVKERIGGTGKSFDWRLVRHIDGLTRPVFLSGGLNKGNVRRAIDSTHPEWLDICSCLEVSPGKKDAKKVKEFIKAVKKR